jgi:CubicO group peptidase (beta-lactamase class C family)
MDISRRDFAGLAAGAVALPALFLPPAALAQPAPTTEVAEPTQSERDAMANLARGFMEKYNVPGFSIAIGYAGKIVYQDALGWGRP